MTQRDRAAEKAKRNGTWNQASHRAQRKHRASVIKHRHRAARREGKAEVADHTLLLSGFRDKLYWRRVGPGPIRHCYKKLDGDTVLLLGYPRGSTLWGSLCGRHVITRTGGQAIERPRPELRCGICDGHEMKRRGWDASGPETV